MGHLVGKDLYRALGEKLDNLTCRVPYTKEFEAILRALYTPEEAALMVAVPYGLSSAARINGIVGQDVTGALEMLAEKGLLMDVSIDGVMHYTPSPFVVGVFEFTMMRTGSGLPSESWAKLFTAYLDSGALYGANAHDAISVPPMRVIPHDSGLRTAVAEVLDFDRASELIERNDLFAMGICSCRHEKHHTGEKPCDVPLNTCASMGSAADYMMRHGFGEAISKEEMREHLVRSQERGLVLTTENVQVGANYLCSCCSCCCNLLQGISRHGYVNTVLSSRWLPQIEQAECLKCSLCVKKCPVDALSFDDAGALTVDTRICIGCGVCVTACRFKAIRLTPRDQQVISPETVFERILLMALERGNLQYQIFDNSASPVHRVLQRLLGGFLRLPGREAALAARLLNSRFLSTARKVYERFYGIDFTAL